MIRLFTKRDTRTAVERDLDARLAARKAERPDPRAYWKRQARECAAQIKRDPILNQTVEF